MERLRKLSALIADYLGLKVEQKELVDRTALLAKADLITHMVYDFPELQGTMGAYYAGSNGEPSEVCKGIVEHYMPRFAGDDFPQCFTGKVVSIADKLDAIVGAFGVGIQPTGSQDPYALRRQALGIVGMLMQEDKDLSLPVLIQDSYQIFADQKIALEPLDKIRPALEDFFSQRIRYVLQENGLRYDVLDAVLAQQADRPYSIAGQAKALAVCREEEGFISYLNAYVRCANLSKKASDASWNPSDLIDPAEIELWNKLQQIAPAVKSKTDKLEYLEAYAQASQLIPNIEKLFEAVMIMVEEESLRAARLGLLQECIKTLGCLGDLTRLA